MLTNTFTFPPLLADERYVGIVMNVYGEPAYHLIVKDLDGEHEFPEEDSYSNVLPYLKEVKLCFAMFHKMKHETYWLSWSQARRLSKKGKKLERAGIMHVRRIPLQPPKEDEEAYKC